jgi:hypothetical protein
VLKPEGHVSKGQIASFGKSGNGDMFARIFCPLNRTQRTTTAGWSVFTHADKCHSEATRADVLTWKRAPFESVRLEPVTDLLTVIGSPPPTINRVLHNIPSLKRRRSVISSITQLSVLLNDRHWVSTP